MHKDGCKCNSWIGGKFPKQQRGCANMAATVQMYKCTATMFSSQCTPGIGQQNKAG